MSKQVIGRYGQAENEIDYQVIENGEYRLVIIKATEGTRGVDPVFHARWPRLLEAGVYVMLYHFFHSHLSGEAQADFFLETTYQMREAFLGRIAAWNDIENRAGLPVVSITDRRVRARDFHRVVSANIRKDGAYSDGEVFTIRRGISARLVVESTKTGAIHKIPCHSNFRPILEAIRRSFSPFIFTNPLSRSKHKNYTRESLGRIWKPACAATGESIPLYAGLKHSTACQLVNDHGLNLGDLQIAGDWARVDSVKRYAVAEPARRKELLEGRVVRLVDYQKTVQQGDKTP